MCTALNIIVAIIHSMACTLAINEFRYVGEDTLANFPTWGFSLLILEPPCVCEILKVVVVLVCDLNVPLWNMDISG